MTNTMCPLPWNSINLRNNGDLRICCNANSYSERKGILRKDDGTPYNAGHDDWNEARNSELAKEIRADMLKGEWNPECERCRQEENSGLRSRREYELADYDIDLKHALEITKEDGTLNVDKQDIEYMDIRYGNFCNLKCRMCGPTDSHTWYGDYVKMTNNTTYKDTHDIIELWKKPNGKYTTEQYNWFKEPDHYWSQFDKHTENVQKLYIVGGEPLIIEEHVESLQRLVDSGKAENIEIEYNSNLTNITNRMLKLWEEFFCIRIGASIDGYGKVFEYQRPPGNWESVYKNLKKLNDNDDVNFKLWNTYTVTVFNVFHFPEFIRWKLEDSGLDNFNSPSSPRPTISEHMCHGPKYYNIKVLPNMIKDEIEDVYEDYIEWVYTTDFNDNIKNHYKDVLRGVVKFMKSEDYSNHYNDFIKHTKELDIIRNQNIIDIVPQYKEMFE